MPDITECLGVGNTAKVKVTRTSRTVIMDGNMKKNRKMFAPSTGEEGAINKLSINLWSTSIRRHIAYFVAMYTLTSHTEPALLYRDAGENFKRSSCTTPPLL